jgi:hypothetical protein
VIREATVSTVDFTGARWRKSSRSGGGSGNSCVEVAFVSQVVGVRDSKNSAGRRLEFPESAWRRFATTR